VSEVGSTPKRTRRTRPARVTRRLARAPGTALVIALLLLAAVGLKTTLAPRSGSTPPSRVTVAEVSDITEQGFAQGFARAYLSWDAQQPDRHQRQVAAFLSGTLDGDGGLQMPARGQQEVLWTTATGPAGRTRRPADHGGRADHATAVVPRRPGAPDAAHLYTSGASSSRRDDEYPPQLQPVTPTRLPSMNE